MDRGYAILESKLGHQFRDPQLIESALTHKSYLNENPGTGRPDNERLEFLGDAVLDLAVSHLLMQAQPSAREGELSKQRAGIVNEVGLSEVAAQLQLGDWLFLGRGEEQSGGRRKPSVLANACEAVVAAVFLDGGFEAALQLVGRLFQTQIGGAHSAGQKDYKTRLQELAARHRKKVRYAVAMESGPDHDKTFQVVVVVGEDELARAFGKSKKEAEQRAAEEALRALAVAAPPLATPTPPSPSEDA
jgi:ribonuclease III